MERFGWRNGVLCVPIGPQYRNGVLGGPIGKHGEIWVEKWVNGGLCGPIGKHGVIWVQKWGFVWPHREAWTDLGGEMGVCVAP